MSDDIARRGWQPIDLARATDTAASTVGRFLAGTSQTARMADRFAAALGFTIDRYLLTATAIPEGEGPVESATSAVPGSSDVRQSPPFDRRAVTEDRRLGGRRRDNRLSAPDRRKEPRRG